MAYSYQGVERANLELYGSYLGVEFMSGGGGDYIARLFHSNLRPQMLQNIVLDCLVICIRLVGFRDVNG